MKKSRPQFSLPFVCCSEGIATKTARNKSYKSSMKTAIKKANVAIDTNDTAKEQLFKEAVQKIDQAVSKGFLHKNTAVRKKSTLASRWLIACAATCTKVRIPLHATI